MLTRRQFLWVGAGLGLTLSDGLRGVAQAAPAPPKAQSVIHIFLPGGLAHQDSFDPKPYAPLEYRGQTKAIGTSLAGVQVSALLRHTAKVADKLTICRAMSHTEAAHERGVHNMLTGYRPSPAIVYPSLGSVVAHEQGPRRALPPYVCVPSLPSTYAGAGYLSQAYGPFSVGGDHPRSTRAEKTLPIPRSSSSCSLISSLAFST